MVIELGAWGVEVEKKNFVKLLYTLDNTCSAIKTLIERTSTKYRMIQKSPCKGKFSIYFIPFKLAMCDEFIGT